MRARDLNMVNIRLLKWINESLREYSRRISAESGYLISSEFIRLSIIYLVTQFAASVALAMVSTRFMPKLTLLFGLIALLSIIMLAGILTLIILRIRLRAKAFDKSMVTVLLVMIPLLAAGEPLINILNYLTMIKINPEVNGEFRRMVNEAYSGLSIFDVIRGSIYRVPSATYREVMNIVAESHRVSGNPADILMAKLDSILRREQSIFRSRAQTLSLMMEVYLVSVQLLPLLLIILTISLSPLGSLPISPEALMLLLFMVYVPLVGIVFYVIMGGLVE